MPAKREEKAPLDGYVRLVTGPDWRRLQPASGESFSLLGSPTNFVRRLLSRPNRTLDPQWNTAVGGNQGATQGKSVRVQQRSLNRFHVSGALGTAYLAFPSQKFTGELGQGTRCQPVNSCGKRSSAIRGKSSEAAFRLHLPARNELESRFIRCCDDLSASQHPKTFENELWERRL